MIAFVCVCHRGEMELKTAFLLHTLKKYLLVPHKIYVAIPQNIPHFTPPTELMYQFFKKNGVKLIYFMNPLLILRDTVIKGDYTSNKVFALSYPFEEDVIVFLDSDIALLRASDFQVFFQPESDIIVKTANRANVNSWEKIYRAADQQFPSSQIITSLDKTRLSPYFNSGVIGISQVIRSKFQSAWHEYMAWLWDPEISQRLEIPLFHRDQVALSLAINKLNLKVSLLPEEYNFPLRGRKIDPNHIPVMVHYHHPYSICSNDQLQKEFIQFLQQTTEINSLIRQHKKWGNLFASNKIKKLYSINLEKIRYQKSFLKKRLSLILDHIISALIPSKNIFKT